MELYWLIIFALLGLAVGSFLNVVIYRLPIMLQQNWREQCQEFLELPVTPEKTKFNIAFPRSHCPHCKASIPFYYNIPLISFIYLRGKCKFCQDPIAWRYPLVELATAITTVLTIQHFGLQWQGYLAVLLSWNLIVLTVIDWQHKLLPDEITLPLIWLGLLINCFNIFATPAHAIIGAASAYFWLWLVGWLFLKIRKMEGMGYGDYKLFAVFGAWLGWQVLPFIILLAAILGAIIGITWILSNKLHRHTPLPFGPYLALAGWLALLYGQTWINAYLQWIR